MIDNRLSKISAIIDRSLIDPIGAHTGTHKNGNANNPKDAKLTGCPDTADTVTYKKGTNYLVSLLRLLPAHWEVGV